MVRVTSICISRNKPYTLDTLNPESHLYDDGLALHLVLMPPPQHVLCRPQLGQLHVAQLLPPVRSNGGTIHPRVRLLPQLPLPQPALRRDPMRRGFITWPKSSTGAGET